MKPVTSPEREGADLVVAVRIDGFETAFFRGRTLGNARYRAWKALREAYPSYDFRRFLQVASTHRAWWVKPTDDYVR